MNTSADELYALIYDLTMEDWEGEFDFYHALAQDTPGEILEIACGTGRIAIRLAENGLKVTATDLSNEMINIARGKSKHLQNIEWGQADMKSFDLGRQFSLIISPGHSFLFMLSIEDQLACLRTLKKHLASNGRLVLHLDHQSLDWLGSLPEAELIFENARDAQHPHTGNLIRSRRAWRYQASTQTALSKTVREEFDVSGNIVNTWESEMRFHCVFRYEMEHLLIRAGFRVEALYGDFHKNELQNKSSEMIWVVRHEN